MRIQFQMEELANGLFNENAVKQIFNTAQIILDGLPLQRTNDEQFLLSAVRGGEI